MEQPEYILCCQKDSYVKELDTTVLSCVPVEEGMWHVVLKDSVIFPEGGGQPCDQGKIGDVDVLSCQRKDGIAVHVTNKPLDVGSQVKVVVDWKRRWDHMQQHTGQHLITALATKLFGWKTLSWNMGIEKSSIDLSCAQISPAELQKLEETIEDYILARHKVTYALYTRDSPELQQVYSRGIPEDVKSEVRVVSIGDCDMNTCCGTHVKDTGDLQSIKILYSEKFKANTKIWFVAGGRVGKTLGVSVGLERQLQAKLQSPPSDFLDKISDLQLKLKNTAQHDKDLLQEIGTITGTEIRKQVLEQQLKYIHHHRSDGTPEYNSAFLVALSGQQLVKKGKQPPLNLPCIVLLTIGNEQGTEGGHVFLSGDDAFLEEAAKALAELLQTKGKGIKGEYRAKAGSLQNLKLAQERIGALVNSRN